MFICLCTCRGFQCPSVSACEGDFQVSQFLYLEEIFVSLCLCSWRTFQCPCVSITGKDFSLPLTLYLENISVSLCLCTQRIFPSSSVSVPEGDFIVPLCTWRSFKHSTVFVYLQWMSVWCHQNISDLLQTTSRSFKFFNL